MICESAALNPSKSSSQLPSTRWVGAKKCSSSYFTYFQDSFQGQDGDLPGQPQAAGSATGPQALQLHVPPSQNPRGDRHPQKDFCW